MSVTVQLLSNSRGLQLQFGGLLCQDDWTLTPRGWIGWVPLDPELVLHLRPRVPPANLFGMLEYSYRLKGLEILPNVVPSGSLEEFFQSLVRVLAARVIDWAPRGLYRKYLDERDTPRDPAHGDLPRSYGDAGL
jgi:5-methylcytosine-specific restriction enzyme subunit McrC